MYAREIGDQTFTFGVSGKLIRNVLVMYDRQTESLWSQLLGEAVSGEMAGTKLAFLPSWMTTWREWQEMHPETVALDKEGQRGSRDVYDDYYGSERAGVIGKTNLDDRLYTKEFVIGVELAGAAVAYPFSVLNSQPVINDTVAGHPLLVFFDSDSATGLVYDRRLDGQALTFRLQEDGDSARLVDEQTGSIWDGFTGEAVAGSLQGQALERVKSTRSFWFGWVDFYPHTAVFGID